MTLMRNGGIDSMPASPPGTASRMTSSWFQSGFALVMMRDFASFADPQLILR